MEPKEVIQNANNCPFCGTDKRFLAISDKTSGRRGYATSGHICVYCQQCGTYGPVVLKYNLPDATCDWYDHRHWFKNLRDLKRNSDGQSHYHPYFVKKDDSEISYDWYYEEAVRLWNERVKEEK